MDPNWGVMGSLKRNGVESYMILNGIKLYPLNYVSLFLAILMTFACYTDEKLLKSQKTLSCDMIKLAMSRDIVA